LGDSLDRPVPEQDHEVKWTTVDSQLDDVSAAVMLFDSRIGLLRR
jgi:hypothetical protein